VPSIDELGGLTDYRLKRMGYNHIEISNATGSKSLTWGRLIRSSGGGRLHQEVGSISPMSSCQFETKENGSEKNTVVGSCFALRIIDKT
jgi:hypothetical protein